MKKKSGWVSHHRIPYILSSHSLVASKYITLLVVSVGAILTTSLVLYFVGHSAVRTSVLARNVVIVSLSVVGISVTYYFAYAYYLKERELGRIYKRLLAITEKLRTESRAERAISVIFYKKTAASDVRVRILLIVSAVAFYFLSTFGPSSGLAASPLLFLLTPLGLLALLEIRAANLRYRILHGLFGTNEYEARELINFILHNSDKIDFTDGDGKLRKALLPEKDETAAVGDGLGAGVPT